MNRRKAISTLVGIIVIAIATIILFGVVFIYQYRAEKNLSSQLSSLEKNYAVLSPKANWRTYTNSQYGFEFQYPLDWTIIDASYSPETNTISDTISSPIKHGLTGYESRDVYYLVKFKIKDGALADSEGFFIIPSDIGAQPDTKKISLPNSLLTKYSEYNISQEIIHTFKFTK